MTDPNATSHVVVTHEAGITTIRLARPEKKNALTSAMYVAITAALRAADADLATRVVIVTGADGMFTAGNDVADFMSNPPAGPDSAVFALLEALATIDVPLFAAVDGPAVGIGTTLLLHCDYVVASDRARFQMPFVPLGLCPEGASTVLLPLFCGPARAAQLLMFGEPFDAASAQRDRLVTDVVPAERVMEAAVARARALIERPAASVRLTKKLLRDPMRPAVREAFAREGIEFVQRLQSDEAIAAFTAFLTRRK